MKPIASERTVTVVRFGLTIVLVIVALIAGVVLLVIHAGNEPATHRQTRVNPMYMVWADDDLVAHFQWTEAGIASHNTVCGICGEKIGGGINHRSTVTLTKAKMASCRPCPKCQAKLREYLDWH